jgi:hypothetical protein
VPPSPDATRRSATATVKAPVAASEDRGERAAPPRKARTPRRRWSVGKTSTKASKRPVQPPLHGRRVTRIVRRVQLWSVFKVALLGGLVFYLIGLVAVGLLWSIATSAGQIHHIEKFMRDVGFEDWTFNGVRLFEAAALVGAVMALAGSVLITLAGAVMNLISELTGGIRFTVIEVDHAPPVSESDFFGFPFTVMSR